MKVKCPDGPRHIYKNPNDAFILYVKDWSTEWNANMDLLNKVDAGLGAKHVTQIRGLFVHLDDANNSMQMEFAAIYQVYCTNPCNKDTYLEEEVKKIIVQVHELKIVYSDIMKLKTDITQGEAGQKLEQRITETKDKMAKALSKRYREEAAISDGFKKVTAKALEWLEGS